MAEERPSERSENLDFERADGAELEEQRSAEQPPVETFGLRVVRVSAFGVECSVRTRSAREQADHVVADPHGAKIEIEGVQAEIRRAAGLRVLLSEEMDERQAERG
jgi:hypothetical protein